MKLNENGVLARLYKWTYGEYDLPTNFCNYFWSLVIAVPLFLFIWISFPVKEVEWRPTRVWRRIGISFLFYLSLIFIGAIVVVGINGGWSTIIGIAIGMGVLVLAIIVGVGGAFTIVWVKDRAKMVAETNEVVLIVKEYKQSVKDKYCPRIDWYV